MRKAHYWHKPSAAELPRNCLVIDAETLPEPYFADGWHPPRAPSAELHTLRLWVGQFFRLRRGKRTQQEVFRLRTAQEARDLITRLTHPKDRLWVVAHNTAFDVGALGLWDWLFSDAFTWGRKILDGGKFVLSGWLGDNPITLTDLGNYYLMPLAKIGESVGTPKMPMPAFGDDDSAWFPYCENDVEVTARAWQFLANFIADSGFGPFAPTAASMAFNTYRKSFMRHKVLVHTHPQALRLERTSYFGGLVETPFVGDIPRAPIYEVDVQSMYPSVCRSPLPTKLRGYADRCSVPELHGLLSEYLCFAEVTLRTEHYSYPVRGKARVYHPVGTYRCVLPDPELRHAAREGDIRAVHRVSWHEHAPIFAGYMETMYAAKDRYKREGNVAYATACKLLMNSLYGKTGQTSPRWAEWSEDTLREYAAQHGVPFGEIAYLVDRPPTLEDFSGVHHIPHMGLVLELRDYGAGLELRLREEESKESCPAIAACVTSYARLRLRALQRIAGAGHWWYSDTDSLWVDDAGLSRLEAAGEIDPGTLGKLDTPVAYGRLRVYGPKDYHAEPLSLFPWLSLPTDVDTVDIGDKDKVRRKGVRARAVEVRPGVFEQLKFPGAISQLLGPREAGVLVETVRKQLHRRTVKYHLLDSGFTRPFRLPEDAARIV